MSVRVTVVIPEDVAALYEGEGTLEEEMSARLINCKNYTSDKPLYFNDRQRLELEDLLKRNFTTAQQLLVAVRQLCTVTVGGTKVPIDPILSERLRSFCTPGMHYSEWLADKSVTLLKQFARMA